ncbi:hypothetical protein B0H11DRAFT_2049043, partial [Mycena galericulata]
MKLNISPLYFVLITGLSSIVIQVSAIVVGEPANIGREANRPELYGSRRISLTDVRKRVIFFDNYPDDESDEEDVDTSM